MLSQKQTEELIAPFVARYESITDQYLTLAGEQIRDIGTLKATNINRLEQIAIMGKNRREIAAALQKASGKSAAEIESVLTSVAQQNYKAMGIVMGAKGMASFTESAAVQNMLAAQIKITQGALLNISRTTATTLGYGRLIDRAVQAVGMGVTDFNSQVRSALRQTADRGMSYVDYESGYTRRIDSAIRMNILDGIHSVANETMQIVGQEFGADGVEISAHALCAADHMEIQGQQYSLEQFEKLDAQLERSIGTLNCHHFTFPIILGVSPKTHTKEQLADYRQRSEGRIEIWGQDKSRYEWSQEQRKIETAIRREKDRATIAKASGDAAQVRMSKDAIMEYKKTYAALSEQAGLTERRNRF